jgi:hypothetical protein
MTPGGNVGIGTPSGRAPGSKLEVQGELRTTGPLVFVDSNGIPYPSNWIGMANNIEGKKWLHIGGITDDGVRRLTLWADRTYIQGNLGIGTPAPTHRFHVSAPDAVGRFESTGTQAFLQLTTTTTPTVPGGMENRVEITNRGGGRLTLWTVDGGDTFNITKAGNVGIGTTAPQAKLDVMGDIRAGNSDIYFTRTDHNHTAIGNTAGFAAIENAANFGALMILGRTVSTTPLRRVVRLWDFLEVNGDLNVTRNATKPGGGPWAAPSDVRLKKSVTSLKGALGKLLRLRGVSFEWKEPEKRGNLVGQQIGLVAQEVEEVFPEWVDTDAAGYKNVTARGFEALTIEAFKELKTDNEALRSVVSA